MVRLLVLPCLLRMQQGYWDCENDCFAWIGDVRSFSVGGNHYLLPYGRSCEQHCMGNIVSPCGTSSGVKRPTPTPKPVFKPGYPGSSNDRE